MLMVSESANDNTHLFTKLFFKFDMFQSKMSYFLMSF